MCVCLCLYICVGYKLSSVVLKAVARRYGGKEGKLAFNEFALAVTKVVSLIGTSLSLVSTLFFSLGITVQGGPKK